MKEIKMKENIEKLDNLELKCINALAEEKIDRMIQFLEEKNMIEEFKDWLIEFNFLVSD